MNPFINPNLQTAAGRRQVTSYRQPTGPVMGNIFTPQRQQQLRQRTPVQARSSGVQMGLASIAPEPQFGLTRPYHYPEDYQPTGIRQLDDRLAWGGYTPQAQGLFKKVGIDDMNNRAKLAKDKAGSGGGIFGRLLLLAPFMAAGMVNPAAGLMSGIGRSVSAGNPAGAATSLLPGPGDLLRRLRG